MVSIELDTPLINTLLQRVPDQQIEFRQGCLLGRFKLPLGAITAVIIPSCDGSHLVFSIPFSVIKGDITGKFLLSKLIKAFWGMISKKVEAMAAPELRKLGLPPTTIKVEKGKDKNGDVGRIVVSLNAVNAWLAEKPGRLTVRVADMAFSPDGARVMAELKSRRLPAPPKLS